MMAGLLWQTCDIIKYSETEEDDDGTPLLEPETVASGVACRFDDAVSRIRQSTQLSRPASYVEEIHGTLYLLPGSGIDETCFVNITGDSVQYQVVIIHKIPGYGGLDHLEVELRQYLHE